MLKSFKEIEKICQKLKLSKKIKDGANIKYKEIFLDMKISSRSNIKKAMYIYCIFFSCNYYKQKMDVGDLIKITNITQKHYDKVISKLEKRNVILSHKKINKMINICNENDLIVNKEEMLKKYQEMKEKKIKLNNNSILLGILFELLNIPENKFIKIFNTTKITMCKFKKYKKILYKKKKIKEYLDLGIFTKEQYERSLKEIKYPL
jgi:transcription initiation factor TFIIIB Brf1 subunit/transcription initiation factor TFIIB